MFLPIKILWTLEFENVLKILHLYVINPSQGTMSRKMVTKKIIFVLLYTYSEIFCKIWKLATSLNEFFKANQKWIPLQPQKKDEDRRKDKVVASVWGEEFIKFLAVVPVFPRTILNNRMNCSRMIWKKRKNSSWQGFF